MNSVNSGRKVMKEEAKKKKRKTRQMGGQNSAPTLKVLVEFLSQLSQTELT